VSFSWTAWLSVLNTGEEEGVAMILIGEDSGSDTMYE
jgi:hypothetical protein